MAKVLIHSLVFSPDGVSTAYLYTDLAIELKKFAHEVSVLTTTPHFNVDCEQEKRQPLIRKRGQWLSYSEVDGIPVWHITMPRKSADSGARMRHMIFFHMGALRFALQHAGKYEVVLSPSPPLTIGATSWLIAKWYKARSIYNVQELYPDFAINQGVIRNPFLIWGLRRLESFVYARSDRIVTIGDRFREAVVSRGVSRGKVLTIPNFVDVDLYRPMPRDNPFAREHGLVGRFVVMYAGNIGLAQHWDPMLEAAERIRTEVLFVVIGNGSRKDWLSKEVRRRGLSNILLLDYQPRERMAEINASSDVATIITDARVEGDGFPSKIYTTMACARPSVVCCSEGSELVRIVRESNCGMWARAGQTGDYIDALMAYRKDPNRTAIEGAAGRAFVEAGYSRQVVARLYHKLIQDVVGSKPNRVPTWWRPVKS